MTFQLFNIIGDALLTLFGGSLFLPILIIGVLSLIILTIRGGKILFFIILVPMVTTIFYYAPSSAFFSAITIDHQWVSVFAWMGLGFIMAITFWNIIR